MKVAIGRAERRLDESERRDRRASVADRVARLALEVELDEAAEVERLSRLPERAVDGEIDLMRSRYKRRPSLGEPGVEDTVAGTSNVRIFGESVARMALELEEAGTPILASRDNRRGGATRRRDALRLAKATVRRFAKERSEISRA